MLSRFLPFGYYNQGSSVFCGDASEGLAAIVGYIWQDKRSRQLKRSSKNTVLDRVSELSKCR